MLTRNEKKCKRNGKKWVMKENRKIKDKFEFKVPQNRRISKTK